MKFYGIADAHGIESFRPVTYNVDTGDLQIDPRELGMMSLRANANRHRHAVVYQVDIDAAEQQRMKVSWSTGSLRIGEYTLPWDMDYENSDIEIFTLQEWIAARAPIQAQ